MMRQLYTAAEAAAAGGITTAADRPMEAGLTGAVATFERQKVWIIVDNASPHLLQMLDEEGSVLKLIWPWSETIVPLRPANERRVVMFHWVSKLSAAANVAVGIWAELTTVEPISSVGFITS